MQRDCDIVLDIFLHYTDINLKSRYFNRNFVLIMPITENRISNDSNDTIQVITSH